MQEDMIVADIHEGQTIEVNLPEKDNIAQIDVYWQDEVVLDLDASLMYIVSGQQEIQDYVENTSKPEINRYINEYAKPIVSEVVDQIATPVIDDYFENTVKPAITEFAEEEMAGYAATAITQAGIATEKASEALETAKIVDEKVQEFSQTAEASKTEFVNFAQEKTEEFEQTAIVATEQAVGSAEVAKTSANNAQASATRSENAAVRANEAITITNANVAKIDNIVENAAEELSKNLNNPFSLLDYKWSEYELNNASWLLSNGAFHSGTVYKAVYELLLKIYNGTETKDGVSVKLLTEDYVDTDFVINIADTTFRLPIKVKLASGNAVVGNGMTLGLTNGTQNGGLSFQSGGSTANRQGDYGKPVGTSTVGGTGLYDTTGITTDPSKSGIETSSNGLKLYFYVGETIQDANVINASGVLTRVAELSDSYISGLGMPSNKYIDLTLGASGATYTAPANGFVYMRKSAKSAGQYILIENLNTGITDNPQASQNTSALSSTIEVKKGDEFLVTYTVSGSTSAFRFVYAEGDK